MRARYLILSPALLLCVSAAPDARPRPKVIDDVSRCRAIQEAAARAACYDTAVPALIEAAEKGTIVVLDKSEVQRTRRSLFGFALPKLPFFGNEREEDAEDKEIVRQVSTTIASVRASGYGLWTITLAEGGVWRTTEPSRTLTPRAGDRIVIKRGLVGGYMATIGSERQIRLQRIG